jgi:hypothetical protein
MFRFRMRDEEWVGDREGFGVLMLFSLMELRDLHCGLSQAAGETCD